MLSEKQSGVSGRKERKLKLKRRDKHRKHTDLTHRAPGQEPLRRGREDWGAWREKGFWLQNLWKS